MWISEWMKCPRCGRDSSLRLASAATTQRMTVRASPLAMLLPTRAPRLEGTCWECDCGAQLCFVSRGFHARDFLAGAWIAAVWLVAGFLTPLSRPYPRLYWFAGAFLVVGALAMFGVGKHEVRVAEDESSSN